MSELEFDKNLILKGAEVLEVIEELDEAYDCFPALKHEGYPEEVEEHKEYTENLVYDLCRDPDGDVPDGTGDQSDNLMENLDQAFSSTIRFHNGSVEQREEIKNSDAEKYRLLIRNIPTPEGIDEAKFLKRFMPNQGEYYDLTRGIIYDDVEVLDRWAEEIERVKEEQEPATTPKERADSADRMFE